MADSMKPFLPSSFKKRNNDDWVDRFNNSITVYLMLLVGLSVYGQEFANGRIICMAKPNWRKAWREYAEGHCLIEGSHFMPGNDELPKGADFRHHQKILYYQWIPLIFFGMSFLLWLPRCCWSNVKVSPEFLLKKSTKSYRLTACYFGLKLWHCINVIVAMIMLCVLVSDRANSPFGVSQIQALIKGEDWSQSAMFPRVSVCEFYIRELGIGDATYMSRKVTECLLTANIWIEKVFPFVWFWLIVLFAFNVINIGHWVWKLLPQNRQAFVSKLIIPSESNDSSKTEVNNYSGTLGLDTILSLRLLRANSNDMEVSDVVSKAFNSKPNTIDDPSQGKAELPVYQKQSSLSRTRFLLNE